MSELLFDFQGNPKIEFIINNNDTVVVVLREWLNHYYAINLHNELKNKLQWISGKITLVNKTVDIPRKLFFLGDDDLKTYKYNKLSFPIESWNQDNDLYREIKGICKKINEDEILNRITKNQLNFNSCSLNYYRDGMDKIDPHSDKEAVGPLNAVVSVSLGDARHIIFRSKEKNIEGIREKIETTLNNSDLLIMFGECQNKWTHGIPREVGRGSRISLTFRIID